MTACSALVTSIITPPLSISARPVFRRRLVVLPLFWDMGGLFSRDALRLAPFYNGGCAFFITESQSHREEKSKSLPRRTLSFHRGTRGERRSEGYFCTYFANIFSGSMAMKVPRLRARTSFFSFRISAELMCLRPSTSTSRPSTRSSLWSWDRLRNFSVIYFVSATT